MQIAKNKDGTYTAYSIDSFFTGSYGECASWILPAFAYKLFNKETKTLRDLHVNVEIN